MYSCFYKKVVIFFLVLTSLSGVQKTYFSPKFSNIIDECNSFKIAIFFIKKSSTISQVDFEAFKKELHKEFQAKNYTIVPIKSKNKLKTIQLTKKKCNTLIRKLSVDAILVGDLTYQKTKQYTSSLKLYGKNLEKFWFSKQTSHSTINVAKKLLSTLLPISLQTSIIDDGMDDLFEKATIIKAK